MKVEWMDDRCMRATLTRGWIFKRTAEIYLGVAGGHWRFVKSDEKLDIGVQLVIDAKRKRDLDWRRLPAIPNATAREVRK